MTSADAPQERGHLQKHIARHAAFVKISQYAMIGLSIILVLLVFFIPALHDDTTAARIVFTSVQTGEATAPNMKNPQFHGMDARNQPYMVTADSAEQQDDGTVLLKVLQADITLSNDRWVAFMAPDGRFDPEKNTLHLPYKVEVFQDDGYELAGDNVLMKLDESTAYSDKPVRGHGPLGKLNADGFYVHADEERIVFGPNVFMVLYPGAGKRDESE